MEEKIIEATQEVEGKVEEIVSGTILDVTRYDSIIDEWFMEYFHGVVDMPTHIFNRAYNAKEALKTKLK